MHDPPTQRQSKPGWRGARRAIAPIPFGPQLLAVRALLLTGGALAASLDLRWWLGLILLIPALLLQVRLGRRAAASEGVREHVLSIPELLFPGLFGAAFAAVAAAVDRRFFALILVAGLILVIDLVAPWQWRRRYGSNAGGSE